MPTLAANLRARLNRDELHQLRWLLGLALVLLAFWTLYNLDVGGFAWRTLFFATAASAMVFPGWPGRIPNWLRRWAFILGASVLFTEFIATQFDFISGLVLLVSLLTLSRALQYRRLREDWQLILLCLFIIILSGVLTLSLWFGLQILIFTLVAMALLFVMNLAERDVGRELTTADWKNFHWGRFIRKVRGAIVLRQLIQAGALFIGLVLVSTIIFISIPRFQFAQSFNLGSQSGVAGFRDKIEYKETWSLDNDDSVAFRVDVPPGIRLPSMPYWRMVVFDEYHENGFRLSNSKQFEDLSRRNTVRYADLDRMAREQAGPGPMAPKTGGVTFYMEGNISEYLPVLGPFDTLAFNAAQTFRANEKLKIYNLEQTSPKAFAYHVENMDMGNVIAEIPREVSPNLTLESVEARQAQGAVIAYPNTYFGLPSHAEDRQIIKELVAQIQAGQVDAGEQGFVSAAITYLRGHHIGSMEMNLKNIDHPLLKDSKPQDFLVRWLDSNSPGWCEYFSGGFVLLCRAAGYPARVVAGYKGASYNSINDYYFVTQSDAHAWAEVLIENRWQRFDPSPGGDVIVVGQPTTSSSAGITTQSGWSAFVDGLRMIWYRRVINFDQTDQQELVAKVSDTAKGFGASVREWLTQRWTAVKQWLTEPMSLARESLLGSLLIIFSLVFLFRRRLRNLWLRVSARLWPQTARQLPPVRLDAGRWLRRLQPVGLDAASSWPEPLRTEWAAVRRELLTLRYGPLDLPSDPVGTFRKAGKLVQAAKRHSQAAAK